MISRCHTDAGVELEFIAYNIVAFKAAFCETIATREEPGGRRTSSPGDCIVGVVDWRLVCRGEREGRRSITPESICDHRIKFS
jgi:hypothetical protein